MTPRERWLRAAERKPVDRVPREFLGSHLTTTSIVDLPPYGYRALCQYLGINDYGTPISNVPWGTVENLDERILERFGCDFRSVPEQNLYGEPESLANGYLRYEERGFGLTFQPAYGYYSIVRDSQCPANHLKKVNEIEEYPYWPDVKNEKLRRKIEEEASQCEKKAKKMYEETDYAITCVCITYSSEMYRWLRGFTQFFFDMKRNPDFFYAFAEKIIQSSEELQSIVLNAIGDYVDRVFYGDDLGIQTGPIMSLKEFREFEKPYLNRQFNFIKKYCTHAKTVMHSCGSIFCYIRDLAEVGVDVIGQQIGGEHIGGAYNMEPEKLKENYGDIIGFWGGVDSQKVLPYYTPDQVKKWVKRLIKVLSPSYILAPNHSIERDSPPQNLYAVLEAYEEYYSQINAP